MRALITRFCGSEAGGAATTYMVFTACWFLIVAAGVQFMTPKMTTKLEAVSAALNGKLGSNR